MSRLGRARSHVRRALTRLRRTLPRVRRGGLWALGAIALAADAALVLGTLWLVYGEIRAAFAAEPDAVDHAGLRNLSFLLAAAVGAPFVVWRSLVAQRQADAARRQTEIADSANITNRITQAVAQLGAEKAVRRQVLDPETGAPIRDERGVPVVEEVTEPILEVRLGGIYALERIAQDSARDHIPILETLCAYVRQNAPARARRASAAPTDRAPAPPTEGAAPEQEPEPEPAGPPRIDIQTVLTVIGRRRAERIADEAGRAPPYRLDLQGTDLRKADLRGAAMQGALLRGADLRGANLEGADLRGADLFRTHLRGANLLGADLGRADMGSADLRGADLFETDLRGADLLGADLGRADMSGSDLRETKLFRAHLDGANLNGAKLSGADLAWADLRGADLRGADLRNAEASSADFQHALLASADCIESTLTQMQFDRAFGDGGTQLPEGVDRPAHWPEDTLTPDGALEAWIAWRVRHADGSS